MRQSFRVAFLFLLLGGMLHAGAVCQSPGGIPPENRALAFILVQMMDAQGAIYTQYQDPPSPGEESVAGHDVLLQNCSLFMLYAVEARDRQLFDQQVALVADYFMEESVGLLHWKLVDEMQPTPSSWGTYSNDPGACLRVVEALLQAYETWSDQSYWDLALGIGEGLRTHNVASDTTLRYYGSWTQDLNPAGHGDRVVLAQLDFAAMSGLARWDRSWEAILAASLEIAVGGMTDHGLFHQSYLPEAKRYDKGDGSMLEMAQTAHQLAVYSKSRNAAPAALVAARTFLGFTRGKYVVDGKIFGRYDPGTGAPLVSWENIAVYALIAQTARELGDVSFADAIISERLVPSQQTTRQSPIYGAFSAISTDAFASDTLEALRALVSRGGSGRALEQEPIRALWYLSWDKDSYQKPGVLSDLRQIQSRICPTHVGLFAIVYQDDKTSSDPHRDPERTATDEALRSVIEQIHRMGMGVILLTPLFPDDESWEGAIRPGDIDQWFTHWQEILVHYAHLAEEAGVEVLLLGSELSTLRNHTEGWDRLIAAVRSIYHGKIGYSVNFWANREEYRQVTEMTHWRNLDYVGVTAYFELTSTSNPSVDDLRAAWYSDRTTQNIMDDLERLSRQYRKPIVFWEIGYLSRDGTNTYPWDFFLQGQYDEVEQADCWTAFLDVFTDIDWFHGFGIYAEQVGLPRIPLMYGVLGNQAEAVLTRFCDP